MFGCSNMKVRTFVNLFDGMSCMNLALRRTPIKFERYIASEVDKYAIKVTQANFPDTVQVGSVLEWRTWDIDYDLDWSTVDYLCAGSPCQGFSSAGSHGGTDAILNGERVIVSDTATYLEMKEKGAEFLSDSYLFWEFVVMLEFALTQNPDLKFLLENVKMSKANLNMISRALGVEPVFINSDQQSAQNRQRYYWANWEIVQPRDQGVMLRDVIETGIVDRDKAYALTARYFRVGLGNVNRYIEKHSDQLVFEAYGLSDTCVAKFKRNGVKFINYDTEKAKVLTAGDYAKLGKLGNYIEEDVPVRDDKNLSQIDFTKGVACRATVQKNAEHTFNGKCPTLTAAMGLGGGNVPLMADFEVANKFKGMYIDKNARLHYRKLTPVECERLQTVPDDYTNHVSNTQRYKMLGNGWTVEVIAHILRCSIDVDYAANYHGQDDDLCSYKGCYNESYYIDPMGDALCESCLIKEQASGAPFKLEEYEAIL